MQVEYSVILPAYDEAKNIERALDETLRVFDGLNKPFEILVVDDGSTDATDGLVEKVSRTRQEVRLVRHDKNRGKGAAVRTGVGMANGEVMLFLDCDLSTHPGEFVGMLPLLDDNDIVIGSRRVKGAKIAIPQKWHRTWSGRLFNLVIRLYLKLPYRDTQCGFKAFKRTTKSLFAELKTDGWAFDVEILAKARARGFKIAEYPVTWTDDRDSRVRLRDAKKILDDLRRIKKSLT